MLAALHEAVDARMRDRHLGTYAIGSLSHGGFAPHVSDVDVVVLLRSPLQLEDPATFADIKAALLERALPLADRLSIFWESVPLENSTLGRLPAVDRLDLLDYGRLLVGEDVRATLPRPSTHKLIHSTAMFIVGMFAERVVAMTRQKLTTENRRFVSKVVLFPVRFLYTLRTGQAGRCEDAVADYAQRPQSAGMVDLVRGALEARGGVSEFAQLIDRPRIQALYDELAAELVPWLRDAGEVTLASHLERVMGELREQLST